MPTRLAQQDNENGMMEAACPQAVSAGLANPDEVRAPRLHPRYFPWRSHADQFDRCRIDALEQSPCFC